MGILARVIDIYSYVILASVILSWVNLPPDNPLVKVITALTEPVLGPLRRLVPSIGGLDFSPLLLMMVLQFTARSLVR
jgi:YggT family protein